MGGFSCVEEIVGKVSDGEQIVGGFRIGRIGEKRRRRVKEEEEEKGVWKSRIGTMRTI